MVLAELGMRITSALNKLSRTPVVGDDDVAELLAELHRALLQADVNAQLVRKLEADIKTEVALTEDAVGMNKRKVVQNAVVNALKRMLDPGVKPFEPVKGQTNVVMFVGLQGSGKTTSCTKYAAYYQRKGFKAALVCADTFRAGAFDQLKQNAAKAKVRFHGSMTESDPVLIAKEGVLEMKKERFDLIIVDTSGRHKQEAALFDEMKQIQQAITPNDIIYVMSATDGQAVMDQAQQFKAKVPVGSVIVTKLDCHAKGGGALSAVAATKSPILFVGTGEHVDDFDLFKADRFVGKMLGMGDVGSFMDVVKDAKIDQNNELLKRLQDGQFTLRDMYEHLQNLMKLGNMGRVLEMIPGMSQLASSGAGEHSSIVLKGFIHMMNSMTPAELDEPKPKKLLTPSRINRIARGSGKSVAEVNNLIVSYVKFEEIVKKMGKMNFKAMTQDPSSVLAGRMGQQQMAQLAKVIDPRTLKQIGGLGGLQNMMKQMGGFK